MNEDTSEELERLEQRVTRIRNLVERTEHEHRAHELVEQANLMLRMCIANYEYSIMQNGEVKQSCQ